MEGGGGGEGRVSGGRGGGVGMGGGGGGGGDCGRALGRSRFLELRFFRSQCLVTVIMMMIQPFSRLHIFSTYLILTTFP